MKAQIMYNMAMKRENLSSEFPTKLYSNETAQLQTLAR